jgi:hypothetical protein
LRRSIRTPERPARAALRRCAGTRATARLPFPETRMLKSGCVERSSISPDSSRLRIAYVTYLDKFSQRCQTAATLWNISAAAGNTPQTEKIPIKRRAKSVTRLPPLLRFAGLLRGKLFTNSPAWIADVWEGSAVLINVSRDGKTSHFLVKLPQAISLQMGKYPA